MCRRLLSKDVWLESEQKKVEVFDLLILSVCVKLPSADREDLSSSSRAQCELLCMSD